ncbi:MAG: hypothetical protein ACJZ65_03130 [Limisphaerales bacterium]
MILPREQRLLLTLGLAVLAYAVLRYHLVKSVPWDHFPLYTTNKVFAVVGLAGLVGSRLAAGRERRQRYGFAGLWCTTVHVLMSLLLMTPNYFGKFYSKSGHFTWQTELSMAAGVLGVGFLLWLLIATLKTETQKQTSLVPCLARWTLLATALHLVFMGGAGWLNRDDWTAAKGLPAITLLAFGLALAGMALKPAAAESDPAA